MPPTNAAALDLAAISERVDLALKKIAKFKVKFTLNPEFMTTGSYSVGALTWSSVRYGLDELDKVPNDTRGVYAFVVSHCSPVLPQHGYVVYVGIAGQRSERSLRERYRDYLNTKKILKRDNITRIIGTWSDVLYFVFAPVPDTVSSDDLIALEVEIAFRFVAAFFEARS